MSLILVIFLALIALSSAFIPRVQRTGITNRNFELQMGGKMSKFGIFSPAVYIAKFVLGEKKLEKVRVNK